MCGTWVTDIRLLFDPMALLMILRAMASGRSVFALPGACPGPVPMNRFAPNGITAPLSQSLPSAGVCGVRLGQGEGVDRSGHLRVPLHQQDMLGNRQCIAHRGPDLIKL